MQIIDFLPKYPNIRNTRYPTFNPYDTDFYQAIYEKKEFHDLKLDPIEEPPTEPGHLMKHQSIIARFLSSHTPYDGLLLVHEMGTGKSCSAFGTIEQIRHESEREQLVTASREPTFKGAVVLARGGGILNNLMKELVFVCTSGQYIPENYAEAVTEQQRRMRIKNKVAKYYQFETFKKFVKQIRDYPDEVITTKFSNKVIVIDEVHNLRIHTEKKAESTLVYNVIHRFLHLLKGAKILLLSGTPMKDKPEEIASIMNLILPLDSQLPTGDAFVKEYLLEEKEGMTLVDPKKVQALKDKFRGRVSFLKAMQSDVKREYVGKSIGDYFKLALDHMSPFQTQIYTEAYKKDKQPKKAMKGSGVYSASRQATLFVFPDKTYGSQGFKNYVNRSKRRAIGEEKERSTFTFNLNPKFKLTLKGKDNEETIANIRQYSSKYATIFEEILARDESCFVYSEYVLGSGAVLFALLLELLGFRKASGNETTKGKRYVLLSNVTATPLQRGKLIDRFNQPDNMKGEIIKVMIGSKVIGEGYSFKNVQQVHVVTPHWNFSETIQAIYRALRLFSHVDLLNAGITPMVRIFLHASVPGNGTDAIDIIMYKISEDKDVSIKRIERLLEEASVDCALTYERNRSVGLEDYSRECEYMKCDYKCDGITDLDPELDLSTYRLFYAFEHIQLVVEGLIELFRLQFSATLDELVDKFPSYTLFELLNALKHLINHNIVILNKYGFPNYLREENNTYFLVSSLSDEGNYLSEYYAQYPNVMAEVPFEKILSDMYYDYLPVLVRKVASAPSEIEFKRLIQELPLNVQEMYLEGAVQGTNQVAKKVREFYKPYILNFKKGKLPVTLSMLMYEKDEVLRCLSKGEWKDCTKEYGDKVEDLKTEQRETMENSPYGYYGIVEKTKDGEVFRIRDVRSQKVTEAKDRRKRTRGLNCASWSRINRLKLVLELGLKAEEKSDLPREKMISKLQKKYTKELLSNPKKISDEELERIFYWSGQTKEKVCGALQEWFKRKGYLEVV